MSLVPFELQQLQCFVTLAETLHFGKAAALLHMTQPPLSRQIAALEERVSVRLFDRDNRSVALTPAGRFFLTEARQILIRAREAMLDARLVAQGASGSLKVGFISTAAYELLPSLIKRFRTEHPLVTFVFKEMLIDEQLDRLAAGTLDIGFVRPPFDASLIDAHPLRWDHWTVALPDGHRLLEQPSIELQHLHGEAFISWSPSARFYYDTVNRMLTEAKVKPNVVFSMGKTQALLAMVRAGLGVAMVPSAVSIHGIRGVTIRRIELHDKWRLETSVAWKRGNSDLVVRSFIDQVLDTPMQSVSSIG